MQETIKEILKKIESLNNDLKEEYERLSQKYGFSFEAKRVIFLEEFRKRNKNLRFPAWKYVIPTNLRHVVSIPFIYGMIIPAVFLDICLTVYQFFAFPLYRIPKARRSDFFIYERRYLDYLNWFEKINCLYCSYVNGLFAYAVEIGARTERYWCPIKSAHKPRFSHGWYQDFADYGNPEEWKEKFNPEGQVFLDSYGEKCFIKK